MREVSTACAYPRRIHGDHDRDPVRRQCLDRLPRPRRLVHHALDHMTGIDIVGRERSVRRPRRGGSLRIGHGRIVRRHDLLPRRRLEHRRRQLLGRRDRRGRPIHPECRRCVRAPVARDPILDRDAFPGECDDISR